MEKLNENLLASEKFLLKEKSYCDLLTNISVLANTIVSIVHDYCITDVVYDRQTLSVAKAHLTAAQELLFSCLERK